MGVGAGKKGNRALGESRAELDPGRRALNIPKGQVVPCRSRMSPGQGQGLEDKSELARGKAGSLGESFTRFSHNREGLIGFREDSPSLLFSFPSSLSPSVAPYFHTSLHIYTP